MFAQEMIAIDGSGQSSWFQALIILFSVVCCMSGVFFILKTKKRNREFDPLQNTVKEQQKQIDELKREVEGMKKTEP